MDKFFQTKVGSIVKEYWRIILVVLAVVVVILTILGFIIHGLTSSNGSADEVAENYGIKTSDVGLTLGGYEYTLRAYKATSDEYIVKNYINQYVNEDAKKSTYEDDKDYKQQFETMMFQYFKFYLSMFGESTDDFMDMYFNQLKVQKNAAYESSYISKDFMLEVFKSNLESYHSLNTKALADIDSGEISAKCSNGIKLSKDEKEEFISNLSEDTLTVFKNIDVKTKKIRAVYKCTVKSYAGEKEVNNQNLYLVKVRGNWYVIDN